MSVTLVTCEEAAELRRQAMEERAAEQVQRDGGTKLQYIRSMRSELPRDTTAHRQVGIRSTPTHRMEKRNGQDMVHLEGIASSVDTPYEMYDWYGPYNEIVHGDAFDSTLALDPDVVFVVNHGGVSMARTIAVGDKQPTLELGIGELGDLRGLHVDAWVNPKRSDVQILLHAIDDGQMTEMSFRFMIMEGRWSPDFMTYTIAEVDIDRGDVSAVNYGANPNTTVEARQQEWLRMSERMPKGAVMAMAQRVGGDPEIIHRFASREDPGVQAVRRAAREGKPITAGAGRSIAQMEEIMRTMRTTEDM